MLAATVTFRFNMWLQFVFLAVCFVGLRGHVSRCPLGFVNHGSSCYLFSHTVATYAEANSFCRFFSSHLAVITSKKEDDFIRGYLSQNGQGKHYYIGGTDLRVEGTWTWEYPPGKLTYQNWGPGQPNNDKGNQHCLHLYAGYKYQWNDIDCNTKGPFVCEIIHH